MDSKPKNLSPGGKLIDDLTVEILSHLPYKSFCRFKCVSKNWLSLSTDPYYRDKLPKPLTGFLYQELDSPVIKVASLCPDDGSFDTSLSFLPPYEWLELVDCCNGLVLCKYGTSTSSPFISLFVVCNPATRQWIELPETRPEEVGYYYTPKLAFNPSWSPYFYVFNFAEKCSPGERMTGITEVAIFSSRDFTWFVDDRWEPENEMTITCRPHFLLDGKFLLHTSDDRVFVVDTFYPTKEPNYSTIDLPGYKPTSPMDDCLDGCLGQSSGILHYAKPAADGCSILIWSLNGYRRGNWNLKHRLSMRDAFGQDVFIRQDCDGFWTCDYDIESLIFLRHFPPGKLLQYSITTGELKEIRDGVSRYMYYVPHCSKFPIQETGRAEESSEP